MSTLSGDEYHHGDLRRALIRAAVDMLERGDSFSLRGVAREVGVSQTAPYRHFPDRSQLESAVAAEGFRDLGEALFGAEEGGGGSDDSADHLADPADLMTFAVVYVRFALSRPQMFQVMFGTECDGGDERVQAAEALHNHLAETLARAYPDRSEELLSDLATGLWSTAHGLACLHLDGKLSSASPDEVDDRVRATFGAVLPPR